MHYIIINGNMRNRDFPTFIKRPKDILNVRVGIISGELQE